MKLLSTIFLLATLGVASAQTLNKEEINAFLDVLGAPEVQFELRFDLSFSDLDSSFQSMDNLPLNDADSSILAASLGDDEALDRWRYFHLFYYSMEQRNMEQAEAYFLEAGQRMENHINAQPEDSIAVLSFVNMLLKAESMDLAVNALNYGIEKFPDFRDLYMLRYQIMSSSASSQEEQEETAVFLSQAIERFPAAPELAFFQFLQRYQLLFQGEKMTEAEKEALLQPLSTYRDNNTESVLGELTWRYGKSFLHFSEILAIVFQQEEADFIDLEAIAEENLDKKDRSYLRGTIRFLEKEHKKGRIDEALMHHLVAMQHFILGDAEKALTHLRKEIDLVEEEDKGTLWESYYTIKMIPKIRDKAHQRAIIEAKYESYPEPEDLLILGILDYKEEKWELATEHLKKAQAGLPFSNKVHELAANIALREGDLSKALDHITKARELDVNSAYAYLLYAVTEGMAKGKGDMLDRVNEVLQALPKQEAALAFQQMLSQ